MFVYNHFENRTNCRKSFIHIKIYYYTLLLLFRILFNYTNIKIKKNSNQLCPNQLNIILNYKSLLYLKNITNFTLSKFLTKTFFCVFCECIFHLLVVKSFTTNINGLHYLACFQTSNINSNAHYPN